jgi:radical SAM protein (TIGR01212 family)
MNNLERYKHLNKYLKEKFGERTLKICIDGGFTCPNRLNSTGCIFCSERGSGDHINAIPEISVQVQNYFKSYKSERANKFIAYFQNFTNTFAPIDILKSKYDAALIDDRIVALAVATRPDCIDDDICKLLKSYTEKYHVWVELGLQTSNDSISNLINRGYSSKQFTNAVSLLNKYNIDVVAHIMIGLPGEDFENLKNTVNFINSHNIQGLKIHCTYIVENTILADMFNSGNYTPISLEYYLDCVTYVLTHISPDIVIHRVSGDAPKDLLIAPEWNSHKKWIINGLDKLLREKDLYQGMYYKKNYHED